MANYHSDEWIMKRVEEHYAEALQYFEEDRIVGIFLQGSQNYGLDYPGSDIDTKLIVLPSLDDIIFNKKPVSTTHVRENNEHIDFKDLRLYIQTFRKQNLNFLEILFTPYKKINPIYADMWEKLVLHREEIARYDLAQAIKSMRGIAKEKYFAMEHEYPSKMDILAKYGYDPKQLHHLLRVGNYLGRYIRGESYESCLKPIDAEYLLDVKQGLYNLEDARKLADKTIASIDKMCDNFLETYGPAHFEYSKFRTDTLLNEVQSEIMTLCVAIELEEREYYH